MRTKLLVLTIILAAFLRLINLGYNPPSLNWDEIAIGWNAYSILQTGRDEYGEFLPLSFRSFDDHKSPVYIYLTAATIQAFGKNEFAVRFPSAFFGIITIPVFYFFIKRMLTTKSTNALWSNRISNISLLSTFMLAVSPWHVHFSRVAFESNVALFWEILGTLFFLHWTENKKYSTLFLSVFAYAVALYTYASARLLIVLLLIGFSWYFKKNILTAKKQILTGLLLGSILCVPLFLQFYEGTAFARYNATTILGKNVAEIFHRNDKLAKEDYDAGNGWLSSKVHNYRIPVLRTVVGNYFAHFNYSFLFIFGDLPRHQVPGFGLLYIWQLPLIFIGAVFLVQNRRQINLFLSLWWLLIAPVPASLTWQVPHAIRALFMLPLFCILSGLGLWSVLKFLQKNDLKSYTRPQAATFTQKIHSFFNWLWPKASFSLLGFCIVISLLHFYTSYSIHLPAEFSSYWLYGRKEAVILTENQEKKYDHITVSLSLDWMYLWFLWYGNYTPQEYLSQGGTVSGGFAETQNKVGEIEFHNFNYEVEKNVPNSLMIGTPKDFPGNLVPNEKILDLSGKPVIYLVKS